MKFQENVKSYLGKYKREVLKIEQPGTYQHNGALYKYQHILPKEKQSLNILGTYRDKFFDSEYSNIDFHKYFHHLNSSQAFCINFFFPLIAEQRSDLLLEALDLPNAKISTSQFELISDIEISNSRKTNFDFFLEIENNKRVYVEVKYTEQKFGSAKPDESHLNKFNMTYWPLLDGNVYIKKKYKSVDQFLKHYQIMRNLVHINESNIVMFFYPKGNQKIHKQALQAKNEILTEKGKDKLKLVSAENAYQRLSKSIESDILIEHFEQFYSKYLAVCNLN